MFSIDRSEEDYFYEEEENASLSPEVESEYRLHRSRKHQPKRFRQRIQHEKYLFLFMFFVNNFVCI